MNPGKIEIYRDKKREWRWRMRASNGRIVADGSEGYKRRASLIKGLNRVFKIMRSYNEPG